MSDVPFLDQLGEELARRAQRDEAARQRRRRAFARWQAPALAAALAAAAFLVLGIAPGATPPGIAERAYAAVTPEGEIAHSIQDITIHQDGKLALHERTERWWDGQRMRALTSKVAGDDVVPLTERVVVGDTLTTYLVQRNQLRRDERNFLGGQRQDDPIAVFRELYRQDKVKPDGTATLDGQEVRRLTMRDGNELRAWLVDPETYQPIQYRITVGNPERPAYAYTARYLTYEHLERTAQTEQRLEMSPHPDAKTTTEPVKPTDTE